MKDKMAKLIEITGKALSGEWGNDDNTGNGIPVLRTTNFTNEGIVNYNNVVTRIIEKKKIEEKYGIEIEGADNDTLKIIDEYFSKLPKGFVEELKKYEGIDNRKIFIKISDEHNENVDFYSDIGKGDYWTIGNGQYMDMGLGCCTMYSIKCNVETRKNTNNFLSDWNDYNPEGFEYGNLEKFKNNMPDNSNDDEDIYFVTEPSMEQESSDWADMFSSMINYDMQVIYDRCSKVRAKAKYLCEEIERAFETVDETAYWNRYFTETK